MAAVLAWTAGTAVAQTGLQAAAATQLAASVVASPPHGHGHHGHHGYGYRGHYGHGPHVGFYYGYRPPVVYAPPPVVYAPAPAPVVVAPAPAVVAPAPYYYAPAPQSSFYYRGHGFGFGLSF